MPRGARFRAAEPRPLRGRVPQAASPFLRSKIINLSHTFSFPTKGVRKRPNTGIDRIRRPDARNGRLFTEGMRPSRSLAAFSPAGVPNLFPDVPGGGGRTGRKTDHCFFRGRIFCIDRRCRAVCAPSLLFLAAGCTFREDLSRSGSRTVRNVVPELSLPGGADRVCRRQESFGREVRARCIRKKRLSDG